MSSYYNNDRRYKKWLNQTTKIFVDKKEVQNLIEKYFDFIDSRGIKSHAANILGIHENKLYNMLKSNNRVSDKLIDKICLHMESTDRVGDFMPPVGSSEWCSPDVTYCGENHADINVSGCGTFFHPHYADGLCQECFENKNNAGFIPRDVRLAEINA